MLAPRRTRTARGLPRLAAGTAALTLAACMPATAGALGASPEFAPPVEVAAGVAGQIMAEHESADMNGDGLADVVVTRYDWPPTFDTYPIGIFLADGTGGFKDGSAMWDGPAARIQSAGELILADFNGDGRSDIFYADSGYDAMPFPGHQNALALSAPGGKLIDATANLPPASDFSHSAAAADIDKDGDRDIYVGNVFGGDSPPYLLLNDGSGRFVRGEGRLPAAQTNIFQNKYARSLFLDVNRDGSPDLVLGADNSTPSSAVLLNDGTGHFSLLPNAIPPKEFGPTSITIAMATLDAQGDGVPDLLLSFTRSDPFYVGRRLQVLIGNGDGTFRDETALRLPQQDEGDAWIKWIRVADVNGDGHADFASSTPYPPPARGAFYVNDGTGVFQINRTAEPLSFFVFLDANGDRRLDIFSSLSGASCCADRHFVHRQLTDDDADGVEFGADNCPAQANPDQTDLDRDALGDACDPDDDGDEVEDVTDNCPDQPNRDQANLDADALGDACDPDDDGDAVEDAGDACPLIARPAFNGCPGATLTKVGRLELSRRAVRTGIQAACPAAASDCTGRAIARYRGKTLGSRKLALSAGSSAAVSVPLNRRGRRLVRDGRKRKLVVALEITGPDSQRVTLTRTGRVRPGS